MSKNLPTVLYHGTNRPLDIILKEGIRPNKNSWGSVFLTEFPSRAALFGTSVIKVSPVPSYVHPDKENEDEYSTKKSIPPKYLKVHKKFKDENEAIDWASNYNDSHDVDVWWGEP